jgi:hypothetical protein
MYPDKKLIFAIAIREQGKSLRVHDLFLLSILGILSYVFATATTQEHEASGTHLEALRC